MAINERTRKEEEDVEKVLKKKIFFSKFGENYRHRPKKFKRRNITKVYQGISKSDCSKPMIKQKSF